MTIDELVRRLAALDTAGQREIARPRFQRARSTAEELARAGAGSEDLAKTVKATVTDTSSGIDLSLRAGDASAPSAHTREFGGTLRPRRGRYLRVPTQHAPAGAPTPLPRGMYRVARSEGGQLMLVPAKGDEPAHYILLREVRVEARPFLRPAIDGVRAGMGRGLLGDMVAAIAGEGGSGADLG